MEVQEVTNNEEWQKFVKDNGPRSGSFLHSLDWACFQEDSGKTVRRFGWYEGDGLVGIALVIENTLKLGIKYGYCPRGPIMKDGFLFDKSELLAKKLQELGYTFLRFEPATESEEPVHGKNVRAVASVQPKHTQLLDLSLGEAELLAQMHHKTRYNIRLSGRKGVEVRELAEHEFAAAWKIFKTTAERDQFALHDRSHYEALLKNLSNEVKARLVGAFYKGELIAVNVQVDFAGTRTYLHGASANKYREVMAPYAIHASEIRGAIEQGIKWYDYWGISDTNPAWQGITRFKRGFGGVEVSYPGTYDLVLNPTKYFTYSLVRKIVYRR